MQSGQHLRKRCLLSRYCRKGNRRNFQNSVRIRTLNEFELRKTKSHGTSKVPKPNPSFVPLSVVVNAIEIANQLPSSRGGSAQKPVPVPTTNCPLDHRAYKEICIGGMIMPPRPSCSCDIRHFVDDTCVMRYAQRV